MKNQEYIGKLLQLKRNINFFLISKKFYLPKLLEKNDIIYCHNFFKKIYDKKILEDTDFDRYCAYVNHNKFSLIFLINKNLYLLGNDDVCLDLKDLFEIL